MAKPESNEKEFGNDKTSFANMPQQVTVKKWPKQNTFDEEYDDSITGIDDAVDYCRGKPSKEGSKHKSKYKQKYS